MAILTLPLLAVRALVIGFTLTGLLLVGALICILAPVPSLRGHRLQALRGCWCACAATANLAAREFFPR